MEFLSEIKNIISGDVSFDEKVLAAHSRDASIFSIKPSAVAFPKDEKDVEALVGFVSARKKDSPGLSLTARCAGTDMAGGPLNDSIVVDFTRYFNRIIEVGDDYAVVQPGVYYRDFEKEAAKKDLLFPSYPASKSLCAMGGIVSNNSGGEKSLVYGKTADYVKELNVVLSDGKEYVIKPLNASELKQKIAVGGFDGKIYKETLELLEKNAEKIKNAKPNVSKNSAGYALWDIWDGKTFDLTRLFVGAQGTLGLITKVKLSLVRPKKHTRMVVLFLEDLKRLPEIVSVFLAFEPESLESYDDNTLKFAIKFFPDLMKSMGVNSLKLAKEFIPDAWILLRHIFSEGIPKLTIIAEFTGDTNEQAQIKANQAHDGLLKFKRPMRLVKQADDIKKYWTIRRESFNLLRHHVRGLHTAPFIDDIIVRPENLADFLPKLDKILAGYPSLVYTIAGHVGDGNFHIIPLMDLNDEKQRAIIPELSQKVYGLVKEYGGSFTAEHNDGLVRTPYLGLLYGKDIVELFGKVKDIFDPLDIFNPRKKVGGDINYALSRVKAF